MKRKYNSKMALESMEALRKTMPDVCFTTDIIVGFPGETEENFNETVEFAKKAKFLMMHVFPYSKRSGTPAALMGDQLDKTEKKRRVTLLSRCGAEIRREILESAITDTQRAKVLFEDLKDGYAYGHTDNFMEVRVKSEHSLRSQIHEVRFVGLAGDIIEAELVTERI